MKKCKYCNKKNIEDDFCSDDCKNLTLVLGLTFFIFPFGNTIDSIGIKNTVYIVCTISTILIILGIVSIVFDFKWPLL